MADELVNNASDWIRPVAPPAIPGRVDKVERVGRRSSRRPWAVVRYTLMLMFALYVAATAGRMYVRKYYIFLPAYLQWAFTPASPLNGPTHVLFLFADHFEPAYDAEAVRGWAARFRELAARHRDANGRPPQHTWFYPGDQIDDAILESLQSLVSAGLGEVELHFHHGYDTAETLRPQLQDAIEQFQRYGFLKTADGRTHFSFVHGNFSLDNGDSDDYLCGVSNEIQLLRDLGCFADFTFPGIYQNAQPSIVNSIYAAKDDAAPKSYDRRLPVQALDKGAADLMIFEGPLLFAPSLSLRHLFLDLDDGNIHPAVAATPRRVDRWVRANVHVEGRPEWVFIKVFAHGISSPGDEEAVLGPQFEETLNYLEHRYNDGHRYVLHYVTAREAYNVAMAAANGEVGNPEQFYDWRIPRYAASATDNALTEDTAQHSGH